MQYLWNGSGQEQCYYWWPIGSCIHAFDWCQSQRPWMTLKGHTHSVSKHTHLSAPTTKIWMKIDSYCQRRRCSPMTLVSENKVYTDIRTRSLDRRRRTIAVLLKTSIVSPFGGHIFGTLRNEANIIIQYYLVPISFSMTAKYVTLNGHCVKFSLLRTALSEIILHTFRRAIYILLYHVTSRDVRIS